MAFLTPNKHAEVGCEVHTRMHQTLLRQTLEKSEMHSKSLGEGEEIKDTRGL